MSYAFPDTDFDRAGSHVDAAHVELEPEPAGVRDRSGVTGEPELTGAGHDSRFPDNDWIGTVNMGGGSVPWDLEWRSNPRADRLPTRDRN